MEGSFLIKFIHTGDIHLGQQFNNASFPKEKAIERRRELWSTFQNIVNYGVEKEVDFLLIAGDLYEDSYFTMGDIKRVRDIFKEAKDINILITAGNHDILGPKSLYNKIEWSSNVTIFDNDFEKKEFPNLDTVIYGYSWDRMEIRENILFNNFNKDDRFSNHILLLHGDISSHSNYLPLTLDELEELNMDYIALGHIHKYNIYNENIAYCGSPEPLDFGEQGDRGIIEGCILENKTQIKFLPFSQRNFYEIDLDIVGELGYQDIINKIKGISRGRLLKDFYRIRLQGYIQSDMDISSLHKDVENNFYHLELINNTIPDYDLDELVRLNKDNIIGQFINSMESKGLENLIVRDALYIGLEVLLKGGTK